MRPDFSDVVTRGTYQELEHHSFYTKPVSTAATLETSATSPVELELACLATTLSTGFAMSQCPSVVGSCGVPAQFASDGCDEQLLAVLCNIGAHVQAGPWRTFRSG